MRRKRTTGATVGAITLLLAAAVAVANPAADTTLDIEVEAPERAGTTKKPKPTSLDLTIKGGTISGIGQPATSTAINTTVPKGWRINTKKWPRKSRCNADDANAQKSDSVCPESSFLGKGSSQALAFNGAVTQDLALRAYVIRNGDVGFWIEGSVPVAVAQMLRGKVKGRRLSVQIPKEVQEPVMNAPTGITLLGVQFEVKTAKLRKLVKVRRNGKVRRVRRTFKIGSLETTACRGGRWVFKVENVYRDGVKTDTAEVPCSR